MLYFVVEEPAYSRGYCPVRIIVRGRNERVCRMSTPDARLNLDPDAGLDEMYLSQEAEPDWYKTNIPCQVGCPAHTDVANYIGLISQGRFDEAYALNRQCNVVPGVIGRGSAGIACARELAEMGYPVTIFDMYAAPGGMMVGGIPVWRLPREVTREECDEYLDA